MASRKKKDECYCDFCGRPNSQCGPLIEGNGSPGNGRYPTRDKAYICTHCLVEASSLKELEVANKKAVNKTKKLEIPTPREIVEHLNQYVIGQDEAKKTLAVSVTNHYKRLNSKLENEDDVEIEKSNVLLLGPTGSGKTLLAKELAKFLDVPFAIGDATTITEAGYVGEDVENLLLKLLHAADMDLENAQRGILYIDEIDKIAKTSNNVSITRDVSGEGVQQSLLKLIEGTISNIPPQGGRKHPEQQYIRMDTTNILVICGGTFVGLEDIVKRRLNRVSIGFGANAVKEDVKTEYLKHVTSDDLNKFGIIPELIGRLPVRTYLHQLKEDALVSILTEPKNALLKQYKKLFAFDEASVEFADDAIRLIAQKAMQEDTGARALRGVVEAIMTPIMYDLPDQPRGKKYTIDVDVITGKRSLFSAKKEAA